MRAHAIEQLVNAVTVEQPAGFEVILVSVPDDVVGYTKHEYEQLYTFLESCGGVWRRPLRAHVFDPALTGLHTVEAVRERLATALQTATATTP